MNALCIIDTDSASLGNRFMAEIAFWPHGEYRPVKHFDPRAEICKRAYGQMWPDLWLRTTISTNSRESCKTSIWNVFPDMPIFWIDKYERDEHGVSWFWQNGQNARIERFDREAYEDEHKCVPQKTRWYMRPEKP